MTISQTLTTATQKLQKSKIPSARMDSEILLARVLKCSKEYLITHFDENLNKSKINLFNRHINRRIKGEPIAYITGHKEFYGLDFFVNKNVLVPRPETELMVEEILELKTRNSQLVTHNMQHTTIIDIGTGNGCIIIALAKKLKELSSEASELSSFNFFATDISAKAIYVAKKNAKFHGVNKQIKFYKGNLLEPLIKKSEISAQGGPALGWKNLTIITANLPYGWNSWKNNCSMDTIGLKFEPQIALFTENEGLKIIKNFLKQIKQITNSQKINFNSTLFALIEFDPRQTIMLKRLIKKILPIAKFQIKKDLCGCDRLACVSLSKNLI